MWMILIAAASALVGAAAVKLYEKNKRNEIADILESFRRGDLAEDGVLKDSMDARIVFLLGEIRREILCTSGKEKDENNQVKGLISDISHQLRNPLANILMYEELLEEEEELHEEQRLFLSNIREAAMKSQWLLKNLVHVSRLETGAITFEARKDFLRQTIVEAVMEVEGLARDKAIGIELRKFEDVPVWQNRRWTREVFVNLLENALKYSPDGTEIHISVKRQVSYVDVSIEDQGIGIPREERRRIFERFYRCRNVEDEMGSGLGLYLVRLILLKENGNVMVEEAPGGGSIFHVFLKLEE